MKIKAPDDFETHTENQEKENVQTGVNDSRFVEEIESILVMPEISSEFVVESLDYDTLHYDLEVLKKFTALCREVVLPRHHKAAETIQSKSDELNRTHLVQQKSCAQLFFTVKELEESRKQLEAKVNQAQETHQLLADRLKEVLSVLKNHCKNRTLAEKKMAQDIVDFKEKTQDLKVNMTATKAKVNYYINEMNCQSEEVTKYTKPLYLDKNRAVFMRSNLNSMRQNIEQLVSRVKTLKSQVEQLGDPEGQEDHTED